jgi:hypothetical protein
MSFLGDKPHPPALSRLLTATLEALFSAAQITEWEIRVSLRNPKSDEEWEVTPTRIAVVTPASKKS